MKSPVGSGNNSVATAAVVLLCAALSFAYSSQTPPSKQKQHSKSATTKSKTAKSRSRSKKGKSKKASWRRGQQKMDSERAHQVQEALIREHYLVGEPTGVWDQKSQNAMERFQADNGWQTKVVPDSRALIKLGLGPNHDHLLNPESAMTSPLQPTSAERIPPVTNADHASPNSTRIPPTSPASSEPVTDPQN